MPDPRRVWKADEIVKLKAMAGKEPGERIAAELGRTLGAVAVEASKLGLSLRTKRRSRSTKMADSGVASRVEVSLPRFPSRTFSEFTNAKPCLLRLRNGSQSKVFYLHHRNFQVSAGD